MGVKKKVKEAEERIICLSEKEFVIIAESCKIRKLVCFLSESETEMLSPVKDSEYPVIIHEMMKRGLLVVDEEGMRLQPEVARVFSLIVSATCTVRFLRNPGSGRATSCVYVAYDKSFVSALPGRRLGEYIRLGFHSKDGLRDYINDTELENAESVFGGLKKIIVDKVGIHTPVAYFNAVTDKHGKVKFESREGVAYPADAVAEELSRIVGGEK